MDIRICTMCLHSEQTRLRVFRDPDLVRFPEPDSDFYPLWQLFPMYYLTNFWTSSMVWEMNNQMIWVQLECKSCYKINQKVIWIFALPSFSLDSWKILIGVDGGLKVKDGKGGWIGKLSGWGKLRCGTKESNLLGIIADDTGRWPRPLPDESSWATIQRMSFILIPWSHLLKKIFFLFIFLETLIEILVLFHIKLFKHFLNLIKHWILI